GRELRPVHALPGRHREGRQADGNGAVGSGAADRAFGPDARCLDLWAGAGGAQSAPLRAEVFSGRTEHAAAELGMKTCTTHSTVVPAKAGTHTPCTIESLMAMGPRLRGDDNREAP